MNRDDVLLILQKTKNDLLKNFGIKKLALFGSYAREDYENDSDVDLTIVDIEKKDYFIRLQAKQFLESVLGKKVDLGYIDTMRPLIRKQVEDEMIYV